MKDQSRGRGYWKLNSSVLEDEDYIKELNDARKTWVLELDDISDKRMKWEYLKYKIRDFTICKCKAKKKKERDKEELLQGKLIDLKHKQEENQLLEIQSMRRSTNRLRMN